MELVIFLLFFVFAFTLGLTLLGLLENFNNPSNFVAFCMVSVVTLILLISGILILTNS